MACDLPKICDEWSEAYYALSLFRTLLRRSSSFKLLEDLSRRLPGTWI